MPVIQRLLEQRQTVSTTSANPAKWFTDLFSGGPTKSGVKVNERTALELSAVYAAVTVASESVASLPAHLYKRLERGKDRAKDHPVYRVIHDRPNPLMTPYQFFETGQAHIELWGNFYAEIERNKREDVIGLWPLLPDRTTVAVVNGQKVFETRLSNGDHVVLPGSRVLHIPGPGFDGLKGRSRIHLARESLGLTKATEQFGATFFGQGARLSGFLTHPGTLKDPEKLRLAWEKKFTGIDNAQRVAVLEEGLQWQQLGIPPEDSQFLETRKFQVSEVARWFRVPPHMIGDLERATFSNIEQENRSFLQQTLMARLKRWEQGLGWELIPERDRDDHFIEFLVTALLRGDSAARGAFYTARFQMGSLSPNDIKELENENPIEGGDQYFVQLNMVPLDMAGQVPATTTPDPAPEDDETETETEENSARSLVREQRSVALRQRQRSAHLALFKQAGERVLNKEVTKIERGIKAAFGSRQKQDFSEFLTLFYEGHDKTVSRAYGPVFAAYADSIASSLAQELGVDQDIRHEMDKFISEYAAAYANRWVASSRGQLQALIDTIDEEGIEAALREKIEQWLETRAERAADSEVVRSGEAVSRTAYTAFGIQYLRWAAVGGQCPMCDDLNGKVVGVAQAFVDSGATVNTGEVAPLTSRSRISHPPLHGGCVCVILPA